MAPVPGPAQAKTHASVHAAGVMKSGPHGRWRVIYFSFVIRRRRITPATFRKWSSAPFLNAGMSVGILPRRIADTRKKPKNFRHIGTEYPPEPGPRIDTNPHEGKARFRFFFVSIRVNSWITNPMQKEHMLKSDYLAKPGKKVDLSKFDTSQKGPFKDKDDAASAIDKNLKKLRAAPGSAVRRIQVRPAGGLSGDRRGRKGRGHRSRLQRRQPAGLLRHQLQGPITRRTRPRLSLAHPPRRPAARHDRDLQSLALRKRPRRASEGYRAEKGLVQTLRSHQRLRENARRRGNHHPQILPAHLQVRAEKTAGRSARRPDEELEVQPRRSRGAQTLGRLHGGVSRTRSKDVPRKTPRGSSFHRTTSGFATGSSPIRSCGPWNRSE